MFINNVIYITDFPGVEKHPVSNSVKQYFYDLYLNYKADLNLDLSQHVYRYNELGLILMRKLKENNAIFGSDITVFSTWGMSWDMEYVVPELHWKNKFNIKSEMLDVRNCGSLCVFHVINLLFLLFRMKDIKKATCCTVENRFLFLNEDKNNITPEIDYVGSFFLSNIPSNGSLELIDCGVTNDLSKYVIPKNTFVIDRRKLSNGYPISSGFVYCCIDFILKNKINIDFNYALIIDFDDVLKSIGFLLVKLR